MSVIITKAGLFSENWCGKRQRNVRKRIKKLSVWTHLRDACEIEEGVTLLDIFRAVSKYKMLRLFLAQYSWCKALDEFHAQAEEPDYDAPEEDPDEKIDYLEVFWHADYGEDDSGQWLSCESAFHGIGKARGKYLEDGPDDGIIRWGISFTPMYSLADLPVKLNKRMTAYEPPRPLKPGEMPQAVFSADRCFSFLDVLDAIYWEVSFNGSPQGRAEMREELNARMDAIKSGEVEGIPIERLQEVLGTFPLPEGIPQKEGFKIVLHPDVLRSMGLDPDDFKKEE
jgi:hypothetical protein